MGREYFLAETLDAADLAVGVLHHQLKIADRHIHVVSNDHNGLKKHHLHAASFIQKSDLVRGVEQGVLVGLVVSLFVFCIVAFGVPWWGLSAPLKQLIFVTAFIGPLLAGGSVGALVGLKHENHKINRFHLDLEFGRHLIMVDSDKMEPIKQALESCPVIDKGEDNTLILPFDIPVTDRAAHIQTAA